LSCSISENMAKVAAQRESLQIMYSNTIDSLSAQGTVQPIIEAVLTAEQSEVGRVHSSSTGRPAAKGPGQQWHADSSSSLMECIHSLLAAECCMPMVYSCHAVVCCDVLCCAVLCFAGLTLLSGPHAGAG
jgi:hypothetical protein